MTVRAKTGDNEHTPCVMIPTEPILLATNQNDAEISQTGICNTLPAAMGMGGGYIPMIVQEIKHDGETGLCGGESP